MMLLVHVFISSAVCFMKFDTPVFDIYMLKKLMSYMTYLLNQYEVVVSITFA